MSSFWQLLEIVIILHALWKTDHGDHILNISILDSIEVGTHMDKS